MDEVYGGGRTGRGGVVVGGGWKAEGGQYHSSVGYRSCHSQSGKLRWSSAAI